MIQVTHFIYCKVQALWVWYASRHIVSDMRPDTLCICVQTHSVWYASRHIVSDIRPDTLCLMICVQAYCVWYVSRRNMSDARPGTLSRYASRHIHCATLLMNTIYGWRKVNDIMISLEIIKWHQDDRRSFLLKLQYFKISKKIFKEIEFNYSTLWIYKNSCYYRDILKSFNLRAITNGFWQFFAL